MIRKDYEVDPLICPHEAWPLHEDCEALPSPRPPCSTHGLHEWGRMKVVAFLTEPAVVDRIIRHLALTFAAEKPPPAHIFEQVALMAVEESGEYE